MCSVKSDGPSIDDMVVSADRGSAKVELPKVAWDVMLEVMLNGGVLLLLFFERANADLVQLDGSIEYFKELKGLSRERFNACSSIGSIKLWIGKSYGKGKK
jgi:hypothetical protein